MSAIQPPPISTPMMLDSGVMSRAWVAWFQSIYLKLNQGKNQIETDEMALDSYKDFTSSINSSSAIYEIEVSNILLSSLNSALLLRASTDSGVTYIEVSNGYQWTRQDNATTTSSSNYSSLVLTPSTSNNQSNYEMSGTIRIIEPSSSSAYKMVYWTISYLDSTDTLQIIDGCGQIKSTDPINAIRVIPSAGSITSGTLTLYSIE